MEKEVFLSQYNIEEDDLEKADIEWEELAASVDEYEKIESLLLWIIPISTSLLPISERHPLTEMLFTLFPYSLSHPM